MKKLLKSKFVTGQSQDQIMKNLLNMSDSDEDEEVADRKIKKLKKRTQKDEESDEADGGSDDDDEKPGIVNKGKKLQKDSEDIRKEREKERLRREAEEKKRQDQQKSVSLFLGESHGHYKMGIFVRIELKIQKKFSRMLVPEYPVVL